MNGYYSVREDDWTTECRSLLVMVIMITCTCKTTLLPISFFTLRPTIRDHVNLSNEKQWVVNPFHCTNATIIITSVLFCSTNYHNTKSPLKWYSSIVDRSEWLIVVDCTREFNCKLCIAAVECTENHYLEMIKDLFGFYLLSFSEFLLYCIFFRNFLPDFLGCTKLEICA